MHKSISALLLSIAYFNAYADTVVYYDSQGFENLNVPFSAGFYSEVSSQSLNTLHPSTPQPYELFGGSTLETILLNDSYYSDTSTIGGNYSLGLVGSPVGTPIYNQLPTVITTNYDAFAVDINTASCQAVESVTVEFDLSLAALYNGYTNPNRLYFPNAMWNGTAVAPIVNIKLFDEQNIDINFNTELQSSVETGVRANTNRRNPFLLEWSHHTVTLPLSRADLIADTALLTISGAGSAAQNENTYVTIDNVLISVNTPPGVSCRAANVASPRAIPTTNVYALVTLLLSLLAVVSYITFRKAK